ncbi:hypothetical protein P691DRAFT_725465 [Macrolepiota fuliginosa MF-IS2]|uniref:MARVEL domain-containing protein n=1 Tax=Macrolepiota fuliginosa MF-IS2 TaxID=1400762 RepID=A0A9P5XGZ0_9AGAR|nr:hypothetical protein P691DRAFT_725465 [Macrolepiota fuliginosa MF-IS2]
MSFHPIRTFLYSWFFAFSVILMGLTAYRTRYTKRLDHPDILTTRQHFYTPIVVELLVVGILGTIWSIWMFCALLFRVGRGPLGTYLAEQIGLWVLFVMSLVGAGVVTHEFSNLKWCRAHHKECRILESIKAFSWIFWGWTIFLIFASVLNMIRNNHGLTGPMHGRRDTVGSYPETRTTGNARPVTTAVRTNSRTNSQGNA